MPTGARVADLLRGFAGDLARHLDFATLERLPASFVTERLGQHHADMLWKIRTGDGNWLYLLILLEFQSTIDRRMAMRMLNYTMRILNGLSADELGPGGTYPPILPVVIYNGKRNWNAATKLRDLFAPVPGAMLGYLPRYRYLLIDLRALDPSLLAAENVVSLMAMLEQARSQGRLEELGLRWPIGWSESERANCSAVSRRGSRRCWWSVRIRRGKRRH